MSVFKNSQRGTWTAKFYYNDWQGNRKQKKKEGFATKKEAQAFEQDFLNKSNSDIELTFKNLTELYLEDCRVHLKPTTMVTKENIIKRHLTPYFSKVKKISDIDITMVRKWQNKLIGSGEFSQTYLKTVHNQLSAMLNFACKFYKLPSNPARECGSMGKKKRDIMQFWTTEEFNRFIPAVSDKPISEAIFTLLFYSGMREGELLALTLDDFDFEKNTVHITKTYSRLRKKDVIQSPKTPKSRRLITLPPEVSALIEEYSKKIYGLKHNDRLFQVTKSYLYHEMVRGTKKTGVKQIRVHDIRHSHASLLIEMGFSPLLISERLGHENIETTLNTYSHLYPNKHSEVADKLSNLIQTSKK